MKRIQEHHPDISKISKIRTLRDSDRDSNISSNQETEQRCLDSTTASVQDHRSSFPRTHTIPRPYQISPSHRTVFENFIDNNRPLVPSSPRIRIGRTPTIISDDSKPRPYANGAVNVNRPLILQKASKNSTPVTKTIPSLSFNLSDISSSDIRSFIPSPPKNSDPEISFDNYDRGAIIRSYEEKRRLCLTDYHSAREIDSCDITPNNSSNNSIPNHHDYLIPLFPVKNPLVPGSSKDVIHKSEHSHYTLLLAGEYCSFNYVIDSYPPERLILDNFNALFFEDAEQLHDALFAVREERDNVLDDYFDISQLECKELLNNQISYFAHKHFNYFAIRDPFTNSPIVDQPFNISSATYPGSFFNTVRYCLINSDTFDHNTNAEEDHSYRESEQTLPTFPSHSPPSYQFTQYCQNRSDLGNYILHTDIDSDEENAFRNNPQTFVESQDTYIKNLQQEIETDQASYTSNYNKSVRNMAAANESINEHIAKAVSNLATSMYSVHIKLDKFSGDCDSDPLIQDWFDDMEQHCEATNQNKKHFLSAHLQNNAKIYYKTFPATDTYEQAKSKLIERFQYTPHQVNDKKSKMYILSQKEDESFPTYVTRMQKRARELRMSENELLPILLSGASPALKPFLMTSQPESIAELMRIPCARDETICKKSMEHVVACQMIGVNESIMAMKDLPNQVLRSVKEMRSPTPEFPTITEAQIAAANAVPEKPVRQGSFAKRGNRCDKCGFEHCPSHMTGNTDMHCTAYNRICNYCKELHHFASRCPDNPDARRPFNGQNRFPSRRYNNYRGGYRRNNYQGQQYNNNRGYRRNGYRGNNRQNDSRPNSRRDSQQNGDYDRQNSTYNGYEQSNGDRNQGRNFTRQNNDRSNNQNGQNNQRGRNHRNSNNQNQNYRNDQQNDPHFHDQTDEE